MAPLRAVVVAPTRGEGASVGASRVVAGESGGGRGQLVCWEINGCLLAHTLSGTKFDHVKSVVDGLSGEQFSAKDQCLRTQDGEGLG
jgi:hypothetical protein